MRWLKSVDPMVQSVSGWATLAGIMLSGFYALIGFLSPVFAGLHWTEVVLLAITMSLGTLLVLATLAALGAWAFRQVKPLPVPVQTLPPKVLTMVDGKLKMASTAPESVPETRPEDLSPAGKPWLRLSKEECEAVKDMLLKLDRLIANECEPLAREIARTGSAPTSIIPALSDGCVATWRVRTEALAQRVSDFGEEHQYEIGLSGIGLGSLMAAIHNVREQTVELDLTMRALGENIPASHADLIKKAARPASEANGNFQNAASNLRNEIRQTRESIAD